MYGYAVEKFYVKKEKKGKKFFHKLIIRDLYFTLR